jgi:2-polyprenyl-3-methyl-5-hydroxy-6-metoxy-1,4-benzoquinol methylase
MLLRFAAAVLIVASALTAAETPEVTDFLKWYRTYRGSFNPNDAINVWSEKLAKDGVAAEEVDRRVGLVRAAVRQMPPDVTAVHFNRIYTAEAPPFRREASAFLLRLIDGVKPGAALDVAMGQGRNALYLASKGWSVTGYDVSDEGLKAANAAAEKAGLKLSAVKATHDEFDYGKERWDLIVQTFAFTKIGDDSYRKRVIASLKPGGILLIEGFGGGGPDAKSQNVVLEAFRELRVLYYENRVDTADWGMGKAPMLRIAVQK